jgi:hypothetical protein
MTKDRKKYIEKLRRKVQALGNLDTEHRPSQESFFELMDAHHQAWLNSEHREADIEADIAHHIAMQKIFKKWREVYDEKKSNPNRKQNSSAGKSRRKK